MNYDLMKATGRIYSLNWKKYEFVCLKSIMASVKVRRKCDFDQNESALSVISFILIQLTTY